MKTLKQQLNEELNKWLFTDSKTGEKFYSITETEEIELFLETLIKWLEQKRQEYAQNAFDENVYTIEKLLEELKNA